MKRESLTTMLVQDLRSMITSRALKPGDRLPTEQEVANAFGVSRTVVREAVARLKAEGLVETRQGVGAFVSDGMTARPFRLDSVEDTIQEVLHVLELRMSVEIEGAGLAALRRTAAQLSQLDRSIRNFEIEIDRNESAVDADLDFHRRIAAATNNPQYLRFLEFLGPYLIPRLKVPRSLGAPEAQQTYLRRIHQEHVSIRDAVAARDADGARQAMRDHLTRSYERYRGLARTGKTRG